jgi:protein TonB
MPASAYSPGGIVFQTSLRRRLASAAMSLALLALFFWMLLTLGILPPIEAPAPRLVSVKLSSGSNKPAAAVHAVTKTQKVAAHSATKSPTPVPTAAATKTPFSFIHLSHDEMAAGDISKLPRADAGESEGSSGSSAKTYGPGEGPGGRALINAEWYREPTRAEMATYLPEGAAEPGNWATIMCKTAEHYHVENCQELDETPGSGLARALRQASWQFLVRPPRDNGKPIIGAWVRIRYNFIKAKEGDPGDP